MTNEDQSLVVMDQIRTPTEEMVETLAVDQESTTEPIRKLASVRKISEIRPIEGADKIVCAVVDGWQLVTQKSNNFQPNDLVVFFEIDSFLPVCELFEFLRPSSFKSTKHLGDGFRIKTIKLKGQVSQGLILPVHEVFKSYIQHIVDHPKTGLPAARYAKLDDIGMLPGMIESPIIEEGADVTEFLGVKKWEKPLDARLRGVARGNFPSFIRKTDQERVQNLFGRLKSEQDQFERWEATLKLDGSSMTVYLSGMDTEEGARFGVCSRNLDLKETEDNTFWQVARKLKLEEKLMNCGRNFALQGELMGPGVQNNREELKEHDFYLFDIWDIDAQRYLTPAERLIICAEFFNDLSHAPMIGTISLANFNSVDDFLKYADRPSLNHKIAEGVVFKRFDGNSSFKVINNKFLLAEKD